MEYVLQWLAQIVLVAYLTQDPVARMNLLMYAVLARHDSLSLKIKWMTTACTLIIFVIQHERLISVDIVPHRNNIFKITNNVKITKITKIFGVRILPRIKRILRRQNIDY